MLLLEVDIDVMYCDCWFWVGDGVVVLIFVNFYFFCWICILFWSCLYMFLLNFVFRVFMLVMGVKKLILESFVVDVRGCDSEMKFVVVNVIRVVFCLSIFVIFFVLFMCLFVFYFFDGFWYFCFLEIFWIGVGFKLDFFLFFIMWRVFCSFLCVFVKLFLFMVMEICCDCFEVDIKCDDVFFIL